MMILQMRSVRPFTLTPLAVAALRSGTVDGKNKLSCFACGVFAYLAESAYEVLVLIAYS